MLSPGPASGSLFGLLCAVRGTLVGISEHCLLKRFHPSGQPGAHLAVCEVGTQGHVTLVS